MYYIRAKVDGRWQSVEVPVRLTERPDGTIRHVITCEDVANCPYGDDVVAFAKRFPNYWVHEPDAHMWVSPPIEGTP